jgi:glycerophosphoryl diester phosphodiesterase
MNLLRFAACLAAVMVAAMGVAGTNGVMVASHRADWQFAPENSLDSKTYAQLPKVLASGSRAFIAATWTNHTAGHDDRVSILESPDKGWGWLVEQGFTIIETNHTRELVRYLKEIER